MTRSKAISSKVTASGLGGALIAGTIAAGAYLDYDLAWLDNPFIASAATAATGVILAWLKHERRPSPSAVETVTAQLKANQTRTGR